MGLFEILLLVVILLLVFGAGKLPAIGDALGRTVKSFRRASRGASDTEIEVTRKTDRRLPPPPDDGADD
ncbi:MAG: twin-arginine translocase TatA/TatE family subunit [Deltaproteobacteria bacterium]|nr:twin-arginine translocase TatA/TatE family subunit [Deltaproteobacteria bacterium]